LGLKPIKCISIKIFRDGQLIQTLHTDEEGRAYAYLTRGLYRFEYWDGDKFLGEVTKYINRATNVHFHQVWKYPPPPTITRVLAPYLEVGLEPRAYKAIKQVPRGDVILQTIIGGKVPPDVVGWAYALPSFYGWYLPPPIVAALDLVAEVEAPADTDTLDVTGLDILTHKFYLIISTFKNPTGTTTELKLYYEGDFNNANYYSQMLYVYGTSYIAGRENFPRWMYHMAGQPCLVVGYLFLDPNGYGRHGTYSSVRVAGTTVIVNFNVVRKLTLSNITRLTWKTPIAGAIGAGSKVQIYGYVVP